MTIQTLATVQAYFETGDIPTQTQFADAFHTAIVSDNVTAALSGAASPGSANVFLTASAQLISRNSQSGTAYTLQASDGAGNVVIDFSGSVAATLTVPYSGSVNFDTGTVIGLRQSGAGSVTVAAAGSVTVNSLESNLSLSGQYACAALEKVDTNTWVLLGALA
jgi:hypothetical protein